MPVEPPIFDASQVAPAGSRNYSTFGSSGGSSSGRYGGFGFGSQGRYGSGGSGASAYGQSQGRWSNAAIAAQQAQSQPQTVPEGEGGFRSALATYSRGGGATTGFRPPLAAGGSAASSRSMASFPSASAPATSTGPRSTAFRPPAFKPPLVARPPGTSRHPPVMSVPPASLASLSASSVAPLSASSAHATHGPPGVTETRASLIPDAVLVNPTLLAPRHVPTAQGDLLASFQRGAGDELEALRRLGAAPAAGGEGTAEKLPSAATGGAPLSPRVKGKGKRPGNAAAATGAAGGKRAKQ